ncbi:MAG: ABC transporter permease [Dehalococcoidia bacterium]
MIEARAGYRTNLLWTISDTAVMIQRNLLRYTRLPQLAVFSSIQPIVFVLLFAYVFGGAIPVPQADYIDFLIPGIIVQVVIFGSTNTGVGLAEDLSKGLVDRFRSLPMSRPAVLAGRTLADSVRNLFVVLLIVGVGAAIGFRFNNSVDAIVAAVSLALLFGFAFTWISALVGMLVRDTETAQVAGFVWVFPLVFASSMFVPVETMPGWLQAFVKVNPVTVNVDTVRALSLGGSVAPSLWKAVAWSGGVLLVFGPIAVHRYRKAN